MAAAKAEQEAALESARSRLLAFEQNHSVSEVSLLWQCSGNSIVPISSKAFVKAHAALHMQIYFQHLLAC